MSLAARTARKTSRARFDVPRFHHQRFGIRRSQNGEGSKGRGNFRPRRCWPPAARRSPRTRSWTFVARTIPAGSAMTEPDCPLCRDERWICEQHPDQPMGHDGSRGAGVPCPVWGLRRAAVVPSTRNARLRASWAGQSQQRQSGRLPCRECGLLRGTTANYGAGVAGELDSDDPPSDGGTGVDDGGSDWCRRRATDRPPDIAAAAVRLSAQAAHAAPTHVRATGRRQRQDLQHSVDHGTPARTIAGPRCGMPAPSDSRPRPAQSARCLRAQLYRQPMKKSREVIQPRGGVYALRKRAEKLGTVVVDLYFQSLRRVYRGSSSLNPLPDDRRYIVI
jgi:hypothetical protein